MPTPFNQTADRIVEDRASALRRAVRAAPRHVDDAPTPAPTDAPMEQPAEGPHQTDSPAEPASTGPSLVADAPRPPLVEELRERLRHARIDEDAAPSEAPSSPSPPIRSR